MSIIEQVIFYAFLLLGITTFAYVWGWSIRKAVEFGSRPPDSHSRNVNRVLARSIPVHDEDALGVWSPDVDGVLKKVEDDE